MSLSYPELNQLHAKVCQVMAEPTRIQIIYALNQGPRCVTELANELTLPQPTVSRHLAVLRHQALVLTERDGPSVIYSLADQRLVEVLDTMQDVLFDALDRREAIVNS